MHDTEHGVARKSKWFRLAENEKVFVDADVHRTSYALETVERYAGIACPVISRGRTAQVELENAVSAVC